MASAVDGDAFQAAFKSLHGFFRAVAIMLIRQGSLGPTTGVAMTYAAVGVAQENAGQKRLHFPIERDLSPRDITAYKKGLMLARQAAQGHPASFAGAAGALWVSSNLSA